MREKTTNEEQFDYFVTIEAKGITLAHEIALLLGQILFPGSDIL
ncbi:hypothetical protein [Oceanispirochaeta sp.]|jgi:adenine/guanine phosphoribosyltransferase-like PRPP-binding protein|nr:hypothetical protein [Oceanispirochaeta sp.]MDA3957240.1 hypothetical protein [Oceanispirochaeta sp.]